LLSGGESSDYSFLVDADPAGENVFFTTRARLVTQDRDEHVDLYDARVHGGFPESSLACTGTGCQGVPPAPPTFATPSSATFNGLGNFLPQPLAKGNPPEKKTAQQIRAARLAKALRACHRLKKRRLRSNCERSARRRYGPAHKIKPSAHRGKKGHKP
jgi:hypothetical protein